MHVNEVRQLLVDFRLIPTPSLDFQVALNFGETAAPLIEKVMAPMNQMVGSALILAHGNFFWRGGGGGGETTL